MNSLRLLLAASALCLTLTARAETLWLTVVGDPSDAAANTVQVDPVPIGSDAGVRLMRIRLNRADETASPQGIKFRSFESIVEFDCDLKTARYIHTEFHALPLWKGAPHATVDYKPGQFARMELRQMQPNPAARIIKAACGG